MARQVDDLCRLGQSDGALFTANHVCSGQGNRLLTDPVLAYLTFLILQDDTFG
jgi:hypothetical protein